MTTISAATDRTHQLLTEAINHYPAAYRDIHEADIDRQKFHLALMERYSPSGGVVVDIGGGLSSFSLGVAESGRHAVLVDDFLDAWHSEASAAVLEMHRQHGVEIVSRDVIADGLARDPESVDLFTTFDSMEHWHNSPKALFAELMRTLKPGGWFLMGVPNCANLRKRIMAPMGRAKWSQMEHWYEEPVFRGHVREPDVGDLLYIANDMGLSKVDIFGRNWQGYQSRYGWVRKLTPYVDKPMRRLPSICADIYLLGQKR